MVQDKQRGLHEVRKKAIKWAVAGSVAFWAANFATSLTPLAAEYRAALSISYLPMIFESLLGGIIVGCCLSYILLRYFEKIPSRNLLLKSVMLSFVGLFIASIPMYIAASRTSDAFSVLLIGAVLNIPRFLALGLVIGYLAKKEAGMKASV